MTLCRWSAKQTITLSVLAQNQTKGLDFEISTRPEVSKGTPVAVGRRNPQKAVGDGRGRRAVGSRHRTAEETSRHEIGSSSSDGRPVKMSQHSSWLVEISEKLHHSDSLHMLKECRVSQLNLLALELIQAYCSFVLCCFSPT